MLNLFGKPYVSSCDRVARRDFLKIGSLGIAGLTLADVLAIQHANANQPMSNGLPNGNGSYGHKALINIFLPGGPPHQDMWDLKPEAPLEIRGEFNPISTNVPGIQICEEFPKIAAMMDKFAIIRSLADSSGAHDGHQCMTGRPRTPQETTWPSVGAWISRLQGTVDPGVPAHMSLMYKTGEKRWGDPGTGGFLGMAHAPFRAAGATGDKAAESAQNMVLQEGISMDRLSNRQQLLKAIDHFRREADVSGKMEGMDIFHQQAMGILTTSKLADALDLSKEDPEIVARYGKGDPQHRADGAPKMTESFLLARRLVEAGARYVSLNFSRWDWHGQNFKRGREDFPMLDSALSALVTDLHERGMLEDVSVVCWGEFGRTPKVNDKAGRDHWPKLNAAILAGGGMKTGQVIGSSNRYAEEPKDRPVKFDEVFATLYKKLGLWPMPERVFDLRGRPTPLVAEGIEPMKELV